MRPGVFRPKYHFKPSIEEIVMKVKTNVKAGALYRCVSEA
jgi:hypothetical protein